ncbi:hypothetical protein BDW74DRAFT_173733 [Aspergillus multicolor]|uniref:uncharacterized protein n=1 Tax=Aspergillus multicolor TaxID=41759 RepID=UPI003CCDB329
MSRPIQDRRTRRLHETAGCVDSIALIHALYPPTPNRFSELPQELYDKIIEYAMDRRGWYPHRRYYALKSMRQANPKFFHSASRLLFEWWSELATSEHRFAVRCLSITDAIIKEYPSLETGEKAKEVEAQTLDEIPRILACFCNVKRVTICIAVPRTLRSARMQMALVAALRRALQLGVFPRLEWLKIKGPGLLLYFSTDVDSWLKGLMPGPGLRCFATSTSLSVPPAAGLLCPSTASFQRLHLDRVTLPFNALHSIQVFKRTLESLELEQVLLSDGSWALFFDTLSHFGQLTQLRLIECGYHPNRPGEEEIPDTSIIKVRNRYPPWRATLLYPRAGGKESYERCVARVPWDPPREWNLRRASQELTMRDPDFLRSLGVHDEHYLHFKKTLASWEGMRGRTRC